MSGAPDPLKSNAADLTGYLDARDHQARDELLAALAPTREEVRRLRAWFRQETPAMVAFANEQRAALAAAPYREHPKLKGTGLVEKAEELIAHILNASASELDRVVHRLETLSEASVREYEFGEQVRAWRARLLGAVPGFNRAALEHVMEEIRSRASGRLQIEPHHSGPRVEEERPVVQTRARSRTAGPTRYE